MRTSRIKTDASSRPMAGQLFPFSIFHGEGCHECDGVRRLFPPHFDLFCTFVTSVATQRASYKAEVVGIAYHKSKTVTMSCSCCPKAKSISSCVNTLTIGTAEANVDYLVVFKIPTGRIDVFEVTSDDDGLIVLEDIPEGQFRLDTMYEVWVSPKTANNINERVTITIGETDVTCLDVQFVECYLDTELEEDEENPLETQTIILQT